MIFMYRVFPYISTFTTGSTIRGGKSPDIEVVKFHLYYLSAVLMNEQMRMATKCLVPTNENLQPPPKVGNINVMKKM